MKIEGSGSGSISQRHGSANPDLHQNVMDPQHWFDALQVQRTEINIWAHVKKWLSVGNKRLPASKKNYRLFLIQTKQRRFQLVNLIRYWVPTQAFRLSRQRYEAWPTALPYNRKKTNF